MKRPREMSPGIRERLPAGRWARVFGRRRALWSSWGAMGFFLLVMTLRLCHLYLTRDNPFFSHRFGDEQYYHRWALAIKDGAWIGSRSFFASPLYAYFLAAIYGTGGSLIAARLCNVLMGAGTILLTTWGAARVAGRTAGSIACVLASSAFALVFYESFAEKTALVLFLSALFVACTLHAALAPTLLRWFAAGLALGAGALAHPTLLAGGAAAAGTLLWPPAPASLTRKALWGASFLCGLALTVAPALLHNYLASGEFVPICANGGVTFYVGNHAKNPDGAYWSPSFQKAPNIDHEEGDYRDEAQRALGRSLKPGEVSAYFFQRGLDEALADPLLSLKRMALRLRWVFHNAEIMDTRRVGFYRGLSTALSLPWLPFGVLSFLGVAGALLLGRDRKWLFLRLFLAFYAGSYAFFVVFGRYRLPVIIPLIILGAAFCPRAWSAMKARTIGRTGWAALLAIGALLALGVFGPVTEGEPSGDFFDFYNMGVAFQEEGQAALAAEQFDLALGRDRRFYPAAEGLAGAYLHLGRYADARTVYEKSILPYHQDSAVWNDYGVALWKSGEPGRAQKAFAQALELDRDFAPARANLMRFQGEQAAPAYP